MWTELLRPEAQDGWHYWASVYLAHALLGVAVAGLAVLWGRGRVVLIWIALGYAGWELAQMMRSGTWDWADALVDWMAVILGAVLAIALTDRARATALVAVLVIVAQTLAGIKRRM